MIPVTLVSGYLGAGKTTLVNHLLASSAALGVRFAVIVNEFGAVGVDNELLVTNDDGIVELSNGCLCCTVRSDLVEALARLALQAERFDRVLVETTGIAEPGPLVRTFLGEPSVSERFRLDGVVTVVDAFHLEKHLDSELELVEQIAFGDRLLLNKRDLVGEAALARLTARLASINPQAPVLPCREARVPAEELLELNAYELDQPPPPVAHHHHHKQDEMLQSFVLESRLPLDPVALNGWLKGMIKAFRDELYRYKGFLELAGQERRLLVQGVHELVDLGLGDVWEAGAERVSRLVLIGRDLPMTALREGFLACQRARSESPPERRAEPSEVGA